MPWVSTNHLYGITGLEQFDPELYRQLCAKPRVEQERLERIPHGDLGNGYFRNPIMVGPGSDNTVVRIGKDFYMMAGGGWPESEPSYLVLLTVEPAANGYDEHEPGVNDRSHPSIVAARSPGSQLPCGQFLVRFCVDPMIGQGGVLDMCRPGVRRTRHRACGAEMPGLNPGTYP